MNTAVLTFSRYIYTTYLDEFDSTQACAASPKESDIQECAVYGRLSSCNLFLLCLCDPLLQHLIYALCFMFVSGLLVILVAVERIGRKWSMALCFFMFSLCILPLYACIGRYVCLCVLFYWSNSSISKHRGGLKFSVFVCVVVQVSPYNLHLHCQSLHLWRIPSCFCLHTRGRSACHFTIVTWNLFDFGSLELDKSSPLSH